MQRNSNSPQSLLWILREVLPYLWSFAWVAVLIQSQCWGHFSPTPLSSPALALHNPRSISGICLLHPGSLYLWEAQDFLEKNKPDACDVPQLPK